MHHRMPPSKTGRSSLNVVIFFTCDAPRPGRPKTVTTPEIIDQIHELILEDRRISAKSIVQPFFLLENTVCHIMYIVNSFQATVVSHFYPVVSFSRARSWLRHYVTSRKVSGSIPDCVIVIFHLHNPSGCTTALGLIQTLT